MANLQKINDLRKKKNLTWKELSSLLEISQVGLQRIMASNSTKIDTLEKISSFFDVPVSYFFDEPVWESKKVKELKEQLEKKQEDYNHLEAMYNAYQWMSELEEVDRKNAKMFKSFSEFLHFVDTIDIEKFYNDHKENFSPTGLIKSIQATQLLLYFSTEDNARQSLYPYIDMAKYKESIAQYQSVKHNREVLDYHKRNKS